MLVGGVAGGSRTRIRSVACSHPRRWTTTTWSAIREPVGTRACRLLPLRLPAGSPTRGVLLVSKDPRSVASDRHGRPGGTLTPVTRFAAACLDPRPPGDALPEEDSNPHSRSNSPTSFRLDDLASSEYRDGESNPGLRVEGPASCPLDYRGMWRKRWTPTHKGLATPTLFRDRPLIWPVPCHEGALGGSRTHDSSVPGTRSDWLSYKGLISDMRLAGTTRTCDPRLRRAVLSSTELRRAERRRQGSNLHSPVS